MRIAGNQVVIPTFLHILLTLYVLNSSPPGQNGHHFTDDIFKCIFINP